MVEVKKKITKKSVTASKTKPVKPEKLAVIETGGKQYLVKPGDKIKIEKIEKPQKGDVVSFDKVLLVVDGDKTNIGTPYLKTVKIKARWVAEKKAKKITNVRYKSKTRRSRKQGHRQIYTEVVIADF